MAVAPNWPNTAHATSFLAIAGAATPVTVRATSRLLDESGAVLARRGETVRFQLGAHETALLEAAEGEDLTGTLVDADRPVAFFSGHELTGVPSGYDAYDHLEEQLPPVDRFGTDHLVPMFRDRGSPSYFAVLRVLSLADDNAVTFSPEGVQAPRVLRRGEMLDLRYQRALRVRSRRPVVVMAYMTGQLNAPERQGDPSMVLIPPTRAFGRLRGAYFPPTWPRQFLTVVAAASARVRYDGNELPGPDERLDDFGLWNLQAAEGGHRIETADGSPAWALAYGVGSYASYAYAIGASWRCP